MPVEQYALLGLGIAATSLITALIQNAVKNWNKPEKAMEKQMEVVRESITENISSVKKSITEMGVAIEKRMDRFEDTLGRNGARTGAIEKDLERFKAIQDNCPTCTRRHGMKIPTDN